MEKKLDIKILIIEDDQDIRELIKLQLELYDYDVITVANGANAKDSLEAEDFDLFIVDRMLPDSNGIELCKYIRSNPKYIKTPIILVTALSEPQDIIEGLDSGADDYITKPFDINILHARVRAQLRRGMSAEKLESILSCNGIKVDLAKCEVHIDEQLVHLTNTEFRILSILLSNPGIVQSRKTLINEIIGENIHVTSRTIDTHIAGLRKKLGVKSKVIETIRGVGYRIQEDE